MSFGIVASSYVSGAGPSGDSAYATSLLTDAPLVYLAQNDASGTTATDISGNGYDGTYSGPVVLDQYAWVTGSTGRATRTDSTGATVTIPHAAWMDTSELTVLLVCSVAPGGIKMIASRYASDPSPSLDSWFVDIGSGGSFVFYYRTSGGSDVVIDSTVVPTQGTRYYVAAYVNASESGIRVYGDGGSLLGSATGVGGVVNTSNSNLVLYASQQSGYDLIGYIDDFAMLGTALTTTRIDELAGLAVGLNETWINKTEGTAARNGTTDHTITFAAASAGSLLVAVTNTTASNTAVTAGWTKQLGPANTTELSVFTMTASGGETDLQITHNAANYPMEWVVYEFPSGSSYHSGVGQASGGPFPTLGSLPGAGVTVFAVESLTRGSGDLAVTTNWRYYWKTDVNRNTLYDGVTNGVFLNIGYFAFNDFPGATASIDDPGAQYDYLHYQETAMFAISHP